MVNMGKGFPLDAKSSGKATAKRVGVTGENAEKRTYIQPELLESDYTLWLSQPEIHKNGYRTVSEIPS